MKACSCWSWKVQDWRNSWNEPSNILYVLIEMRDRVFVRYMGSSRLEPVSGLCGNLGGGGGDEAHAASQ